MTEILKVSNEIIDFGRFPPIFQLILHKERWFEKIVEKKPQNATPARFVIWKNMYSFAEEMYKSKAKKGGKLGRKVGSVKTAEQTKTELKFRI